MFSGLFTAVATPFDNKFRFDAESFERLISFQATHGADGVVIAGSTGESPTVTQEEFTSMLKIASAYKSTTFKVIASIGSNCTVTTLHKLQLAESLSVDGMMAVAPYYNRPNAYGLYEHFRVIAEESSLPIMLYNIPARTGIDMSDELIARLAQLKNIVALKDATGDLARPIDLASKLQGSSFKQLSGEDATAVAFNASGGVGVVSVTSNIAPQKVQEVQKLTAKNDYVGALRLNQELYSLHKAMFLETNPAPVKYALYRMGIFSSYQVRMPLTPLSSDAKGAMDKVLAQYNLVP